MTVLRKLVVENLNKIQSWPRCTKHFAIIFSVYNSLIIISDPKRYFTINTGRGGWETGRVVFATLNIFLHLGGGTTRARLHITNVHTRVTRGNNFGTRERSYEGCATVAAVVRGRGTAEGTMPAKKERRSGGVAIKVVREINRRRQIPDSDPAGS